MRFSFCLYHEYIVHWMTLLTLRGLLRKNQYSGPPCTVLCTLHPVGPSLCKGSPRKMGSKCKMASLNGGQEDNCVLRRNVTRVRCTLWCLCVSQCHVPRCVCVCVCLCVYGGYIYMCVCVCAGVCVCVCVCVCRWERVRVRVRVRVCVCVTRR